MELGLSLGDASRKFIGFLERASTTEKIHNNNSPAFCMGLDSASGYNGTREEEKRSRKDGTILDGEETEDQRRSRVSADPPLQLDLLPRAPVPRNSTASPRELGLPWPSTNSDSEPSLARGFDVNRPPSVEETNETVSSPNSTLSSFQLDFSMNRSDDIGSNNKRDLETLANEIDASRASDDEENGLNRKKLRLSKEQSAFLEESFKEHHTLNPKQKLALAKQLNLRPRQVEVWFQNRRARTKLKQTEVDCEYLKRCCETLTAENRRLQKELQELRTLKTSNPFYMQLPATTLTMCPSCERVATTTTSASAAASGNKSASGAAVNTSKATAFSLAKPLFYQFSQQPHPSAAS